VNEAEQTLALARERANQRAAATPRIDYAGSNREFKRQKAALTRAINSGDKDKIVLACRKAVREWSEPPFNGAWPDDWSRWQRALDDALPWNEHVELDDLR
jgi:hypothetical protein